MRTSGTHQTVRATLIVLNIFIIYTVYGGLSGWPSLIPQGAGTLFGNNILIPYGAILLADAVFGAWLFRLRKSDAASTFGAIIDVLLIKLVVVALVLVLFLLFLLFLI